MSAYWYVNKLVYSYKVNGVIIHGVIAFQAGLGGDKK